MANPEHVELVKSGGATTEWREVNLDVVLDLHEAKLFGADLSRADLIRANLTEANLSRANLRGANLSQANLIRADLREANLSEANLIGANLSWADLIGADLWKANLSGAHCGYTVFADIDLPAAKGVESIRHEGPSTIGVDTFFKSKGKIPEVFLRGCGLTQWEALNAKLYDPDLQPSEISELQYKIFSERTTGAFSIGGVFISYAWGDDESKFVDKLRKQLFDKGLNVWLDKHDMKAGDMVKQVDRAIRINDVVIVVLSGLSVESDWVEHELESARKKEKSEKRDVLCPLALDSSWLAKVDGDPLWRQLKKKLVVDFSKWKTKSFDKSFQTLLDGLQLNYEKPAE